MYAMICQKFLYCDLTLGGVSAVPVLTSDLGAVVLTKESFQENPYSNIVGEVRNQLNQLRLLPYPHLDQWKI